MNSSFSLPPHDLSHVAFRIPDDAPADQVRSLVTDPDVEVLLWSATRLLPAHGPRRPALSAGLQLRPSPLHRLHSQLIERPPGTPSRPTVEQLTA